MQHIAESCRNLNVHHIGTDDQSVMSYGSTTTNLISATDVATAQDQYDAMQTELDQLKEQMIRVRTDAEPGRGGAEPEEDLANEWSLSTRRKKNANHISTSIDESAAARLRRLHEAHENQGSAPSRNDRTSQVPPSPLDFPALAPPSSPEPSPMLTDEVPRKLSYANAATNGMMEAIGRAFPQTAKQRADSKVSQLTTNGQLSTSGNIAASATSRRQTASTLTTLESQEVQDEEHSVIIASNHHDPQINVAEGTTRASKAHESPNGKNTMKQSPSFAQPTKSFARRTGETLGRSSASVSPKSPADGSPVKSTKTREPNLATAKRAAQQHQKRKSLPGDWLAVSSPQCSGTTAELAVKSENTFGHIADSTSSTTIAKPNTSSRIPQVKENMAVLREKKKEQQPQSPLRKKASSYMAPTNATTQRTIATLGHNIPTIERAHANSVVPQTDVNQSLQLSRALPRPMTPLSDSSSVHFILDGPAVHSPQRRGDTSMSREDNVMSTGKNTPTPVLSKSPPAAALLANTQRSPTRGPKARPAAESPMRKQASQTTSRLPTVANTTTMRRTSHSNVLTPIVARLYSEGLLNRSPEKNVVFQTYLQNNSQSLGSALRAARERAPGTVEQRSPQASTDLQMSPERAPKTKVVPPHLRYRSREASTTSTNSASTLCLENVPAAGHAGHRRGLAASASVPEIGTVAANTSHFQVAESSSRKASTPHSLRATAKEFKPTQSLDETSIQHLARRSLGYISPENWAMLSGEERMEIAKERELYKIQRRSSKGAPSNYLAATAGADMNSTSCSSDLITQRGMPAATMNFVDENGSPNNIEIGPMLKPTLINPRKKTVQWMLQNLDGTETPAKFGRAPAPSAMPVFSPSTATISSRSEDTSPPKTPNSVRGWQIGSTLSHIPYGWTGGDGKEIKFIGYGPHAERDPNSVVNFNFQGRTSSFGAGTSNGYHEEKENFSHEYVAPRSQRQWAEKLGYHRVPCGDLEITHAVEQIPFGSQLANYCHDCMAR